MNLNSFQFIGKKFDSSKVLESMFRYHSLISFFESTKNDLKT